MKKLTAPLQKKNVKKTFYYSLAVSLAFAIGNYISGGDMPVTESTIARNISTDQEAFSEEALLSFMKELKIKYPETVLSQARLETGNFTSVIFKENNNLFGMKVAEKRPTSAIGVNRNHAQYKDWKDSVIDYALFQSYIIAKLPASNIKEYRSYIQKFYSETSDYLVRIDRTIEPNNGKLALLY